MKFAGVMELYQEWLFSSKSMQILAIMAIRV